MDAGTSRDWWKSASQNAENLLAGQLNQIERATYGARIGIGQSYAMVEAAEARAVGSRWEASIVVEVLSACKATFEITRGKSNGETRADCKDYPTSPGGLPAPF